LASSESATQVAWEASTEAELCSVVRNVAEGGIGMELTEPSAAVVDDADAEMDPEMILLERDDVRSLRKPRPGIERYNANVN